MVVLADRIKEIEEEITKTPYNKASEHHIGKLKAKLSQLKEAELKKGSPSSVGFGVKKSGNATVVLVGFPSVGKSTILNKLTNAESKVGEYEFTTLKVIPGMMDYNGTKIQILDLPGIITGASSGSGRGKEVLSIARNANLIMILVDALQPKQLNAIVRELNDAGIRIDQTPPRVDIKKVQKGGVRLISTVELTQINERIIRSVLNVYGIHSAEVTIREDITTNQFIDVITGNRIYVPSLVVVTKIDLVDNLKVNWDQKFVLTSAKEGFNMEKIKEEIYNKLKIIRLYMKPRGKKPDYDEPLILRAGSTVADICDELHRDIRERFRYAQIWGNSVKFDGQIVGLDHLLEDKDVVTIIKRI